MASIRIARQYAAAGIPVPADVAFDLLAAGICPETLKRTDGGPL